MAPLLTMKAAAPLVGPPGACPELPSSSSAGGSSGGGGGSAGAQAPAAAGGGGDFEEGARKLRLERAHVLLSAAAAFELEDSWQWKPLMDGKQVGWRVWDGI
jgi:hypothetical protein